MNRFITKGDGKCYIIDALGMNHEVNTWHRLPMPEGIERGIGEIVLGCKGFGDHTHWLARAPLPPFPQPKSQAQIDDDGFQDWREKENARYTAAAGWHAALAWERARKEKR